jgi:hypothetical protein
MVAASDLVQHLARITGIPISTAIGIKRRFVETGIWPSSRGAHVPGLNTHHVVMMLLALLADVPAKDAASAATSYFALADADGYRLGEALANIIDSFKSVNDVSAIAYKSRVTVDCDRPRVCISFETTEGQFERLFGVQAAQWSDIRVRRSMTISGKCLFDLACGLHFNRWEPSNVA